MIHWHKKRSYSGVLPFYALGIFMGWLAHIGWDRGHHAAAMAKASPVPAIYMCEPKDALEVMKYCDGGALLPVPPAPERKPERK